MVVPAGWKELEISELCVPRKLRIDPRVSGGGDICVELEHIAGGSGQLLGVTNTSGISSLKTKFEPGDVLFGKLRAYLRKYWLAEFAGVCSTEIWALSANRTQAVPGFLAQIVRTEDFIEAASLSYGTHMPRSDWAIVSKLIVSVPPLKEQEAIAEALSDIDVVIGSLDALTVKKRDVKQATMQQLLTGRARLPGFTADWKELELSRVAEIGPGINKALSEMGTGSLYVTVEDIYSGSSLDVRRLGRIRISRSEIERFSLQVGDLVLGKSSVKRDGIGYPNLFLGCAEPVVPSGFTYRVRPDKEVLSSMFLLQYLRSRPARKWIIDNSQSSALTNINSSIINRYPIIVPPLKEQEAIAETLSAMDDELDALAEQTSKLRMMKEGMMQDLLTGKVRLV